jgi:hypothetical protein
MLKEIRITKFEAVCAASQVLYHSGFVIDSAFDICAWAFASHPLRQFNPKKIQPELQNSRSDIAQSQSRAARGFV